MKNADAATHSRDSIRHRFRLSFGLLLLSFVVPLGFSQEILEPPSSDSLLESSLILDINTAVFDQLVAWCRILELDATGSEQVLRERLRSYYSLGGVAGNVAKSNQIPTAASGSSGSRVIIESAKRSEYFTVDIGDENETMVRLSGDVLITVEETERGRTHRVRADSVVFNQAQNSIVAVGNISYVVNTNGREEKFTGDSLSFEVSNWTGVIFRGSSARQQDVDGEMVDFFFRGESIKKPRPEILILEEGVITSHDVDNPDFSLRAKKIWITGPGEWGLFSATLYVGHVPMLYLPFYWKSGSDLFFNPVIGFRTGVGYFIQTTSYFLGRKEEDEGFSMMGFGDSAAPDYDLKRDGLFLVKSSGTDSESSPAAPGSTLKYMMDVYTSLGAMAGLYGDFPNLGDNGKLNFYTTVAVSRSVDEDGSVYFAESGEEPQTHWNSSYLGSAEIPLRWGSSLKLSLKRWSLVFDWYSDPFYRKDFDSRKENFDWINFLLSEEGTDINEPDLISDMKWEITGSQVVNLEQTSPWLSSISLDNFRSSLTWRSKDNSDITTSSNSDRAVDPARRFYYPDTLIMPDIRVSARGGSPQWVVKREIKPESVDNSTSGVIDGAGAGAADGGPGEGESGTGNDSSEDGAVKADYIDSLSNVFSAGLLKASIGYGLSSQLYIEDQSANSGWTSPSEVDFKFQAAKINSTQRGDVNYRIDFWDGLTGVNGVTNISGYLQTHSDIFGTDAPVSDTTRLEDYKYSKLLLDNRLNMYLKPFQGLDDFSKSQLTYTIDTNLFSRTFRDTATVADPSYENLWINDAEDFRKHELGAAAVWTPGPFELSFSIGSNIPPLSERHTLKTGAGLAKDGWRFNFSQQSLFEESQWSYQPISLLAAWEGWQNGDSNEVLVSQSARYDVENNRLTNTESIFGFWGFETRLVANYGKTYEWNKVSLVWEEGAERFEPTGLRFSYKRNLSPPPSWRNRLRYKTSLSSVWDINLSQPSANELVFKWTQELHIFKFIDLKLSLSSANKSMYLYFPWWREQLGITEKYSFFEDLAKSFNIFSSNQQDRRESRFNMDRIDLSLIHHLRNWDASLDYSGWPALDSSVGEYRWKSEVSFQVKWNPLPMFRQRSRLKEDEWTVDSLGTDAD